LVKSEQTAILVDAGPDLRQQLLRSGQEDIDAVLITHEHQDHTAGLDELRAINFQQNHPVPVYCSARVESRLREQYSYIFNHPDYPGIPQLHFVRLPEEEFKIGDIRLEAVEAQHGTMPVHGFRFGDFFYLTDANKLDLATTQRLQGLKTLVVNALRKESHHSHFNLDQAQDLARRLAVKDAYFTHISHHMGLHAEVLKELPKGAHLAYDGLKISAQQA
jgi:phosphoribosyl 1,2-cyclic phosphate phosphodiesterase